MFNGTEMPRSVLTVHVREKLCLVSQTSSLPIYWFTSARVNRLRLVGTEVGRSRVQTNTPNSSESENPHTIG